MVKQHIGEGEALGVFKVLGGRFIIIFGWFRECDAFPNAGGSWDMFLHHYNYDGPLDLLYKIIY